jgi:hypothetical protein
VSKIDSRSADHIDKYLMAAKSTAPTLRTTSALRKKEEEEAAAVAARAAELSAAIAQVAQ